MTTAADELYKQADDYYKVGVVNVKVPAVGSIVVINDEYDFVVIDAHVDDENKNKLFLSLGRLTEMG